MRSNEFISCIQATKVIDTAYEQLTQARKSNRVAVTRFLNSDFANFIKFSNKTDSAEKRAESLISLASSLIDPEILFSYDPSLKKKVREITEYLSLL